MYPRHRRTRHTADEKAGVIARAVSGTGGGFSTQCGAPLDPANGGYSLLTPHRRGRMAVTGRPATDAIPQIQVVLPHLHADDVEPGRRHGMATRWTPMPTTSR